MRFAGFRTFIAGSILAVLPASPCRGEAPPEDLVRNLGSEEYRVRIRSQGDLIAWAQARADRGEDLLLAAHDTALDPEIRLRLRETLKEIVIAEHQKDASGYVGIRMKETLVAVPGEDEPRSGVLIDTVNPRTPASRAGLKRGDVILSFGGEGFSTNAAIEDFAQEVKRRKAGERVEMEVLIGGEVRKLELTLAPRPMGLAEVQAGTLIWPGAMIEPLEDIAVTEARAKEQYFQQWLAAKRASARAR
jgi:hypothetical protein